MGGPNPDRAAGAMLPQAALTLSEMAARRWKLRANCDKCGLMVRVSVDALIRCHGAYAEWWGRRPPCPRLHDGGYGCEGHLTYYAQGGRHASWTPLTLSDPDQLTRVKAMRAR